MKLFKVSVEVEFYMMAEDEDDALFEAEDTARDAMGDGGADAPIVNAYEVTDLERVPKQWRNSLPYRGEDDLTIAQILTTPEPDPEPTHDTQTIDMFVAPEADRKDDGR